MVIRYSIMKPDLLDIICCPVCKGDLELRDAQSDENEIISGKLVCKNCGREYPIEDGIPDLLPK